MRIQCPACGAKIQKNFNFCPECSNAILLCPNPECRAVLKNGWKVCPQCGVSLREKTNQAKGSDIKITESVIKDFHHSTDSHDSYVGIQNIIGKQFSGPTEINIHEKPDDENRLTEILRKVSNAIQRRQIDSIDAIINEGLVISPHNETLLFQRNFSFLKNRAFDGLSLEEGFVFEKYCRELFEINPKCMGNTLMYFLFRNKFYPYHGVSLPTSPDTVSISNYLDKIKIHNDRNCKLVLSIIEPS